jgi:hypothetical protein
MGLTLSPDKRGAANAAIEKMIASDYDGALRLCDSITRADAADPLGWMLSLAAIGLHDLDLDSATDSLNFDGVFKKGSEVIIEYERLHGVSSYSLTVKGFVRATAAAYDLWRKKYFAGLDLGLDALARLQEAKKLDNSNTDVDFFLGLYTYARAELKKTFWWAFFWYPGDREDGIRSMRGCARNAQFCRRAASLALGEVYYREHRFAESDSVTADFSRLYPGSRLVKWTCAKRAESAGLWGPAGDYYRNLADAYDSIPRARRNSFLTRNKAAHMYFSAGNFAGARKECSTLLDRKAGDCNPFCRQLCDDTERLLAKMPDAK